LAYIFTVTLMPPDANSDTIVSLVLGYLGGTVSAVISFYFGASQSQSTGAEGK
jgi:Mn2+/Fe2+ NRAMP family transporter